MHSLSNKIESLMLTVRVPDFKAIANEIIANLAFILTIIFNIKMLGLKLVF